jgi:hypothetical protein
MPPLKGRMARSQLEDERESETVRHCEQGMTGVGAPLTPDLVTDHPYVQVKQVTEGKLPSCSRRFRAFATWWLESGMCFWPVEGELRFPDTSMTYAKLRRRRSMRGV